MTPPTPIPDKDPRTLLESLTVFAVGLAYLLGFDPFERAVGLDPATWDYMSISLLDGRLPYRDIFLHKTPLAAFIGGLGAWLASLAGLEPLDGAHAVFVGLAAAGPALLYALLRPRTTITAAAAAALWMFAFDQWLVAGLEGVRPKIATTTLGLAALVSAQRGRFVLAGWFGGLSTLCWQPGLAFIAGAVAAAPGRPSTWVKTAFGAILPPAVLIGWFYSLGIAERFYEQAVLFNTHYIALHARTPLETLEHLFRLFRQWNAIELLLLVPAGIAAVRYRSVPRPLVVATLAYTGLVFVSIQSWPDMILFAPGVAAVLGLGLAAAMSPTGRAENAGVLGLLALALAFVIAAKPDSGRVRPPIDYEDQAAFMASLTDGLGPNPSVVTVSYPELLIHSGLHSRWTWPYMWFGVDRFAADSTHGGFDAILADLESDPPDLMIVARRWAGPNRRAFERWAAARYGKRALHQYPHTVRPINVYRLREG